MRKVGQLIMLVILLAGFVQLFAPVEAHAHGELRSTQVTAAEFHAAPNGVHDQGGTQHCAECHCHTSHFSFLIPLAASSAHIEDSEMFRLSSVSLPASRPLSTLKRPPRA